MRHCRHFRRLPEGGQFGEVLCKSERDLAVSGRLRTAKRWTHSWAQWVASFVRCYADQNGIPRGPHVSFCGCPVGRATRAHVVRLAHQLTVPACTQMREQKLETLLLT
eukprot:4814652-Pyramimonas_sp.AAC.2